MSRYVLALDQGTTSSRSLLFDRDGTVVALAQREFPQYFPQPGWVEHDAEEIWSTQSATIAEVLRRAGARPADIAAIGITNQRETTVLWDRRTGTPVAPAIVWQDRRTAGLCAKLRERGVEDEVSRRTGLLLDPYFSGTKIAWLLETIPGLRRRAEDGELAFGTIDSWLAWKLTGGAAHVTDVTNAGRTLLFDIEAADWSEALLDLLGVPRSLLPALVPSSFTEPAIHARIEGHLVPIAGIAGDQQAALFGQTCFEPGMAKNTYGTGCFMLLNTGGRAVRSRHRLLTTLACGLERREYALEGAVFVGGAVVQWLRDGLGIISSATEVEALARSVPDSNGVMVVPAFTGLGSPHWDAAARGTIVGLSRGATRAHLARAALEAIAFQCAELLAAMQQDAARPLRELRVDGGATANDLLMQFQADLLGVPVLRPRVTETTALGAAYLAGLAVGYWGSRDELATRWRSERSFEPELSRDEAGALMQRWSRAVERAKGWDVGPGERVR
jgi:glycerol kinase